MSFLVGRETEEFESLDGTRKTRTVDVPRLLCRLVEQLSCQNFTNPNCTYVPREVLSEERVEVCELKFKSKTKEIEERNCGAVVKKKECEKEIVQVSFDESI